MNIITPDRIGSRLTQAQIADMCAKRPPRVIDGGALMTGFARLSFPALHEKHSATQGGVAKYGVTLLLPHDNVKLIGDWLAAAVRSMYPSVPDPSVMLDRFNKDHPLRDQALRVSTRDGGRNPLKDTTSGYVSGFPYMAPKSGRSVPCFVAMNGQWVAVLDGAEIQKHFYGGAWVEAKLVPIKSSASAKPGVSVGINGIWKLADDTPFGGGGGASAEEGGSAADAFDSIPDPNLISSSPSPAASFGSW